MSSKLFSFTNIIFCLR